MKFDDRELAHAFRVEADRIDVPHRNQVRHRRAPSTPLATVVLVAVVIAGSLVVARVLGEFRTSLSSVAASATPGVTAGSSPSRIISDRDGLITDDRPPMLIAETQTGPTTKLRGDFFRGAVSPDGRKIAYWETYSAPIVRSLWLLDTAAPAQSRLLLMLPESETAAVSTGNAVAWSSDGTGLLIAVNSAELARPSGPPDASPLYSTLRQIEVADGSVREIVRYEAKAAWFNPLAWDRANETATAAVVGPGGFATGYIVLRDGAAPVEVRLPAQTLSLQGFIRPAPDASAVLMRGFPENQDIHVWPLAAPSHINTLRALSDEYVTAAMWRNAREIVVSLSRASASEIGDRLEIWGLDGSRRVVLTAPHRLDAVRTDGTAVITDKGVVDLASGAIEDIPGLSRVRAAVVMR